MNAKARCQSCRYARTVNLGGDPKVVAIGQPKVMQCRRFPPQTTALLVPGQVQGSLGVQSIASWPSVTGDDGCGEFIELMLDT